MHRTLFDHARLDLLSLAIWSRACFDRLSGLKLSRSTALERKCFDLRSLSPALHSLWLLLVIYISIPFLRLGVAIIYTSQSIKPLLRAVDSPMKPHYGVSSGPTIPCKELNLFTSCPNESALSSSALDLHIRATPCTRILMSKIVKNDVIRVLPITCHYSLDISCSNNVPLSSRQFLQRLFEYRHPKAIHEWINQRIGKM